jgi:hypothetical protein
MNGQESIVDTRLKDLVVTAKSITLHPAPPAGRAKKQKGKYDGNVFHPGFKV